jgi:hypothetical protein
MAAVKDKNVEIDGKTVGGESLIKLNVKTALWIIGAIVSAVMTILTWSYFDLKSDWKTAQQEILNARKEFIEKVDEKVDNMDKDIQSIRIDQATIKGDIKLILDRQNRDNPVRVNPNISVQPTLPPDPTEGTQ